MGYLQLLFIAAALFIGKTSFAQALYCSPVYSVGCKGPRDINTFVLDGVNQTSINDSNTACSPNSYDIRTHLPAVDLYPGYTHTGSITSQSLFSSEYVKIWIDFDDDGFTDTLDLVGEAGPIGPTATHFSVTVPMFVDTGLHRMRVRSAGPNYGYGFDECSGYLYGETHDYMVNIVYPTCSIPYSLEANNVTPYSVDISWLEPGITTQWEVEYGLAGFKHGNGKDTVVNNNSIQLAGLVPNTSYDFYVRSVCGRSDTSYRAGPYSFLTGCLTINSFPYFEDFDGNANKKVWDCWSVINKDGGYSWKQDNTWLTAKSSPYMAHSGGGSNDMLVTPLIIMPSQHTKLMLWDIVANSNMNSIYSVLVSTTGIDTADFTDTLATFNVTNEQWTQRTIDLSAYSNQNIYIALWQSYTVSPYWPFGVDDFTIDFVTEIEQEKPKLSSIFIYPNPSNGIFHITGEQVNKKVEFSIFNTSGKMIYKSSEKFSNNFDERIDISGFAKGLYFVKLQSESSMEMKKVVIK